LLAGLDHEAGARVRANPYVRLSRARASIQLGSVDARTTHDLDDLANNPRLPEHVRWAAVRWIARAGSGAEPEVGRAFEALDQALRAASLKVPPPADTIRGMRAVIALTHLDRALATRDHQAAATALDDLRQADPGPVEELVRAAERRQHDTCEYVARFYPY
jgi:hypothetical protein